MNTNFRWESLEVIRESLSETISENNLKKRFVNALSEFDGKAVSIRVSKRMKELFPEFSIYISENIAHTEKELVFSHWNEIKRNREDIKIKLLAKEFGNTEWEKMSHSWIVSNSGIAYHDAWILKISMQLNTGHWERYFAKRSEFELMYKEIKAMEV